MLSRARGLRSNNERDPFLTSVCTMLQADVLYKPALDRFSDRMHTLAHYAHTFEDSAGQSSVVETRPKLRGTT
eukprot:352129-Chlamydomonas_euryale.AAC.5